MISRRTFLHASAAAAGVLAAPGWAAAAQPTRAEVMEMVRSIPLAKIGPFAPAANYAQYNRWFAFDREALKIVVDRFLRSYQESGDPAAGEYAIVNTYLWWRTMAGREDRIKIAVGGKRLSEAYAGRFPDSPVGHMWAAVFTGTEALSRGLLEALHLVPEFQRGLARVDELDPTYFYAMNTLLRAKMYIKVPPFPMSIGNVGKGVELLTELEPAHKGKFALWYLFHAEAELVRGSREQAFAWLDRMAAEVEPVDVTTAYLLDTTTYDAAMLRRAVAEGSYDRYTWDPLLEPAKPASAV